VYRLAPLWLVLVAAPAQAADIGSSYWMGWRTAYGGPGLPTGFESFPSLDIRTDDVIVQTYPIDLLVALTQEDAEISVNVFFPVHDAPVTDALTGVVQPGVSADLFTDPFTLGVAAAVRLGVEAGQDAHVGAYVVPELGLVLVDGEAGLVAGGKLEMSVWF
jgi:hypothetical protein